MYSRVIFSIASFMILLLIIVYFFAKSNKNMKLVHKIFAYLLITDLFILLLDIAVAYVYGMDMSTDICKFVLKLRFFFDCIYFSFNLYYYYCASINEKYHSLKDLILNSKLLIIHFIFSFLALICYVILPVNEMTKETFVVICGPAFYLMLGYCIFTSFIIILIFIFSFKHLKKVQKFSLIFYFFMMIIVVIAQFAFPKIMVLGLSGMLNILAMYFISENPDLELVEEINSFTDETYKVNKIKSDFLSNISREIQAPMSEIIGFSDNILNSSTFDLQKFRNDIKLIDSASKDLIEIINNFLDFSLLESDTDILEERDYSLKLLLNKLTGVIQDKIGDKKISLILDIDETIPDSLHGDYSKIYQILMNILTNSVKYTEVGRITICLEKEAKSSNFFLKFKISDTGSGIKKENFDKIFQKFSQNENDGSGLGLVITKRYVDLMGGEIWFESEYGVGTTFFLEIPQQINDITSYIGHFEITTQKKFPDLSSYKILIVDNNKLNLNVAKRILEKYHFQIETCTSGQECIFRFKKGEQFDLIFLDHYIPGMDGIQVVHIIRKLPDYKVPPLIALTANAIAGANEMYLKEGFDDYLSKPINPVELDFIIQKYFQSKKEM